MATESAVKKDRSMWLMALPPLFAVSISLFVYSAAGAANVHGAARGALAVGALAGLLAIWAAESSLLGRLLDLPFEATARKIALSWLPLAILPLSIPYFHHDVISQFLKEDPTPKRVVILAIWLTAVAVAGSVALKFVIFSKRMEGVIAWVERHAVKMLWGGAALYFAVFFSLSMLAYHWYVGYHSDLGQYSQTMWASLHGNIFYSSLEETGMSYLGTHISPFLLVVITPLYGLWQSPKMYLLLRTLALTLAVVPLFYIVKHYTKTAIAGLLLGAAFLLHPEIVSQNFTSGYETIFAAAPFFAAFYFFLKERFWPFMGFIVLACAVREDIVPVAVVFGIYAFFKRRNDLKWVLAPLGLGLAWGITDLVIFKVVIQNFMFRLYYEHLGETPGQMAQTIVFHPIYTLQEIWRIHRSYLYNLLSPVGFFTPWTSLASLFALPNMGIQVLRQQDASGITGGISHYSPVVVSAIFVGVASFVSRVQKWVPGREKIAAAFMGVLILAMVVGAAHIWSYFLPVRPVADRAALDDALAMIPPGHSLASNDGRALSHMPNRWGLYEPLLADVPEPPDYLPQGIGQLQDGEYVLLRPFNNDHYNDEEAFAFVTAPGTPYTLIFQEQDIKLYHREPTHPDRPLETWGTAPQ